MNKEINDERFKKWAKDIYTTEDVTAADIALTIGIDESTIAAWVLDGGWDGIRKARLTSKKSQLEYAYNALENLSKIKPEKRTIQDAEAVLKYSGAIKALETQPTVSEIIEVFELFINWMRRRDLIVTKQIITHFDTFVQMRINA